MMDSTHGFTRRKIAQWAEFVCYMADATREGVAAFWMDGKVRVYRIRAQKKDYQRAMRQHEDLLIGVYNAGVHATAVYEDIAAKMGAVDGGPGTEG